MYIEIDLEVQCLRCDETFRISPGRPIRVVCNQCEGELKVAIDELLHGRLERPETASADDFVSVEEACRMLGGISRTTLWRHRQEKPGLATYEVAGRPVFKRGDVRRLARRRDD